MQCFQMPIRGDSMTSLDTLPLMVQAEPVALISPVWIWEIYLGIFSEISSEVEEAIPEETDRLKEQIFALA